MAFHAHFPGAFPHAGERTYTFSPYSHSHPLNDFFRLVGGGVDHRGPNPHAFHAGFPFAQGPCRGRGGRHRRGGPRARRDPPRDPEKTDGAEQAEDPPEVAPEAEPEQRAPHDGPTPFPFDPSTLGGLFNHPLAQHLREFVEQVSASAATDSPDSNSPDTFTPPLDLFETDTEYVLHLALPGAKKEDVGVDWDAEKGELRAAGVVHRPGDEEFLRGLRTSERTVGVFERKVKLPPGGDDKKEEVDGEGIVARMEDGVLVVRVPKVEKEWTEIRKIDIE